MGGNGECSQQEGNNGRSSLVGKYSVAMTKLQFLYFTSYLLEILINIFNAFNSYSLLQDSHTDYMDTAV